MPQVLDTIAAEVTVLQVLDTITILLKEMQKEHLMEMKTDNKGEY